MFSSITKNSRALREEIDYGINYEGLPVIVIYPEYSEKSDIIYDNTRGIKQGIKNLWDNLPIFRGSICKVPTLHVPYKIEVIMMALYDCDFMIWSKGKESAYY